MPPVVWPLSEAPFAEGETYNSRAWRLVIEAYNDLVLRQYGDRLIRYAQGNIQPGQPVWSVDEQTVTATDPAFDNPTWYPAPLGFAVNFAFSGNRLYVLRTGELTLEITGIDPEDYVVVRPGDDIVQWREEGFTPHRPKAATPESREERERRERRQREKDALANLRKSVVGTYYETPRVSAKVVEQVVDTSDLSDEDREELYNIQTPRIFVPSDTPFRPRVEVPADFFEDRMEEMEVPRNASPAKRKQIEEMNEEIREQNKEIDRRNRVRSATLPDDVRRQQSAGLEGTYHTGPSRIFTPYIGAGRGVLGSPTSQPGGTFSRRGSETAGDLLTGETSPTVEDEIRRQLRTGGVSDVKDYIEDIEDEKDKMKDWQKDEAETGINKFLTGIRQARVVQSVGGFFRRNRQDDEDDE